MIAREELVRRHNPRLTFPCPESPLTVGNGEFAFTVDVTGLQTLYREYKGVLPLCTQSQWGWHTTPVSGEQYAYSREELELTPFDTYGRTVWYPVERHAGNEQVYDWMRENPHRLNLGRIGLTLDGQEIEAGQLSQINQVLDLYQGVITSAFSLDGERCLVRTCVSPEKDQVNLEVYSPLLAQGRLAVELTFPYGSPGISASDWGREEAHASYMAPVEGGWEIQRELDRDQYRLSLCAPGASLAQRGPHRFSLAPQGETLWVSAAFGPKRVLADQDPREGFVRCQTWWEHYWENGAMVSFQGSTHPGAMELERRVILSQYLTAVQCAGSIPPQETGLTCNSWHGIFHLEMHFWHAAHFYVWNRTALLERSMGWYVDHLPDAQALAKRQGYRGARWTKMATMTTTDIPSPIAPLLIWQQPHVAWLLECCYQADPREETLGRYREVMFETVEFMADFAVYEKERDRYVLGPPLIPAQENHDPRITKNPTYELEYWRFGLELALRWKRRLGEEFPDRWVQVLQKLAKPPIGDGVYLAHENCPDTFRSFCRDHPSMLCGYGLLPPGRMQRDAVERTLRRVLETWDFTQMWGWDFGVMAMTATALGLPELAVELLLRQTEKNYYTVSGNNRQISVPALPLYLPGNGSLLLAVAMMARGTSFTQGSTPGFPKNGEWQVKWEQLRPLY